MRCHFTSVRMAIIKRLEIPSVGECGEKGTLVHCWWNCKLVHPLWKTVWSLFKKIKNRPII